MKIALILIALAAAASAMDIRQNSECALCEFVIQELVSVIEQPSTETSIEAALDKVCGDLPASISNLCQSFVNTYTPEVVQLLASKLQPQSACTAIGLCTSSL